MPDTVELREYVCPDCGQSAIWTAASWRGASAAATAPTRIRSSHSANHLRSALIRERAQLPGVLELSPQEWAAVDAELAPLYVAVAHRFLRKV